MNNKVDLFTEYIGQVEEERLVCLTSSTNIDSHLKIDVIGESTNLLNIDNSKYLEPSKSTNKV